MGGLIDHIRDNSGDQKYLEGPFPESFWDNFEYAPRKENPVLTVGTSFFSSMSGEQFKSCLTWPVTFLMGSDAVKYIEKRCKELNIKFPINENEEKLVYGVNSDGAVNGNDL